MNEIQAGSLSVSAAGLSSMGGSIRVQRGAEPGEAAGPASQSVAAGSVQAVTSETYAASSSATSLVIAQDSQDDLLAMLVMMLVQFLLGNEEDEKNRDDAVAGLLGLMLMAGTGRSGGSLRYFESETSQVYQSTSTVQATAVQATAYGQTASAAPATGARLDVTG